MTEIFKKLKYPNQNYEISNYGRLRRKLKDIRAIKKNNNNSYKYINGHIRIKKKGNYIYKVREAKLTKPNGKRQSFFYHCLIAEAFLGKRPMESNGKPYVVDHIDGNSLNNNLSNLQYITHADNLKKAKDVGNSKYGFTYSSKKEYFKKYHDLKK